MPVPCAGCLSSLTFDKIYNLFSRTTTDMPVPCAGCLSSLTIDKI